MSTELRRVQRHRARPVWPLRDVDACRRTMGMGPQAVVRDVGCFLLMNFVICKKMYNIYIQIYFIHILFTKMAGEWCEPLLFLGGGMFNRHRNPCNETGHWTFLSPLCSIGLWVDGDWRFGLSGRFLVWCLVEGKKSFDTRCSFLDYGGHDGLNGLEHCEDFFKRSLWVFQTEVLRPKIPCDLSRFCWPCFHLECFFFWPPAPSEDNSIAYFEHRKEQTLASCKELCRAMANRRPVLNGWDPRSTSDRWNIYNTYKHGSITPFIG